MPPAAETAQERRHREEVVAALRAQGVSAVEAHILRPLRGEPLLDLAVTLAEWQAARHVTFKQIGNLLKRVNARVDELANAARRLHTLAAPTEAQTVDALLALDRATARLRTTLPSLEKYARQLQLAWAFVQASSTRPGPSGPHG